MSFHNDWHTIITFGKFKGKRLNECDRSYIEWLYKNLKLAEHTKPVLFALERIRNRRSVTKLVKEVNFECPILVEIGQFQPVPRPPNFEPKFFGTFFELLVKYWKGIREFDCAVERLACCGLIPNPRFPHTDEPTEFDQRYFERYQRITQSEGTIDDILFIADCSPKMKQYYANRGFDTGELTTYSEIAVRCMPKFNTKENLLNDQISVGCVLGKLDGIHEGIVYEIKVCKDDDLVYWSKQLWTYASLHRLRYGTDIQGIKAVNYLTGKIFCSLGDWANINAREHIKQLGSYCPEHLALFE